MNKIMMIKSVGWLWRTARFSAHTRKFYDCDRSMISNIQAIKRFDDFAEIMEKMSPLTPRALSFAARKMGYYCTKSGFYTFDQTERELFHSIFTSLFQMNEKMLSPSECLNILYFLRVSNEHADNLEINRDEITKFISRIATQLMKNIEYLNFNRCCDFLQEIERLKANYGIDQIEDEEKVLKVCLDKFPPDGSQEKFDSIFHFISLNFNILRLHSKIRDKELLIRTTKEVRKLGNYFPLPLKLRLVDESVGSLSQIIDQEEKRQVEDTLLVVLTSVRDQMSKKTEEEQKNCAQQIDQILKEISETRFQSEDIMIRITIAINDIKKLKKTEKELQEEQSNAQQQSQLVQ